MELASKPSMAWRLLVPTGFLLAIAVVPLPWLEVRWRAQTEPARDRREPPPERSVVLVTQSGIHAIYGGYGYGPRVHSQLETARFLGENADADYPKTIAGPAPWLAGYSGCLAAGLLFGAVLPFGRIRLVVVILLASAALATLGHQTVVQFPIVADFPSQHADHPLIRDVHQWLRPLSSPALFVQYTPFFYLAWGFGGLTVLVIVAEWLWTYGPWRPKPAAASAAIPVSPYLYDDDGAPRRTGDEVD